MKEFFQIHSDLPREGPGDDESLNWALSQLDLGLAPRTLDAGCGPGADIPGLLAHRPHAQIVALDTHAPFIDQLRATYGDDPRVQAGTDDMARPEGRFDLIWTAGALYFLGVRTGLEGWRDHLEPGGAVIFSELSWRGADRPEAAADYWQAYEAMQDAAGVLADTEAAGYRVLAHRYLPDAAWEAYYQPIEARLAALEAGEVSPELRAAIDAERTEIAVWRAHKDAFGYLQVVAVLA